MSKTEIIIIAFLILVDVILYFRARIKNNSAIIFFIVGHKAGELAGAEEMSNALYRDTEKNIRRMKMSVKICGLLKYHCLKCGQSVNLEVRLNMTENTIALWESLFDAKLCLDCHTDRAVLELVECLVN